MRLGKTWTILIIAQVSFAVALLPPALSSAWENHAGRVCRSRIRCRRVSLRGVGNGLRAGNGRNGGRRYARVHPPLCRPADRADAPIGSRVPCLQRNVRDVQSRRRSQRPDRGRRRLPLPSQSEAATSGSAIRSETEVHEVRFNRVDVNFFRTFEVPILAGRGFEPADIASAGAGLSLQEGPPEGGAVVVNLPFAQRIFGGNALGRRIRYVDRNRGAAAQDVESGRWYEIVGIVSDFPTGASPGMRDTEQLKVYHAVAAGQVQPAAIAIRMRGGAPSTFTQRLREIAAAVDPDLHLRRYTRSGRGHAQRAMDQPHDRRRCSWPSR